MALVLLGGGVTDIRGSIGGTTFSRNQGGNYARARTKPINQRSALQTERRARISELGRSWWDTLDQAERENWVTYAEQTSWTNRLGQTISISGIAAYVRTNVNRIIGKLAQITEAPPSGGHAGEVTFSATATESVNAICINSISAPWDPETDGDLVNFYVGLPSSAGRKAVPKTFRWGFAYVGKEGDPPPYADGKTSPYRLREGQRLTLGAVHTDPDGRVAARSLSQIMVTGGA